MVLITNNQEYVKIDLTDFIELEEVVYSIRYLMKDQAIEVSLEKNNLFVLVITNGNSFQLDMNGELGLPAKVGNTIPSSNPELAELLAELKNL